MIGEAWPSVAGGNYAPPLPAIARYLVAQGAEVFALTPQHLSLEELFIQIVGTDGGL